MRKIFVVTALLTIFFANPISSDGYFRVNYDVNPNPEKDLRLLDYLERRNLDLSDNKL